MIGAAWFGESVQAAVNVRLPGAVAVVLSPVGGGGGLLSTVICSDADGSSTTLAATSAGRQAGSHAGSGNSPRAARKSRHPGSAATCSHSSPATASVCARRRTLQTHASTTSSGRASRSTTARALDPEHSASPHKWRRTLCSADGSPVADVVAGSVDGRRPLGHKRNMAVDLRSQPPRRRGVQMPREHRFVRSHFWIATTSPRRR